MATWDDFNNQMASSLGRTPPSISGESKTWDDLNSQAAASVQSRTSASPMSVQQELEQLLMAQREASMPAMGSVAGLDYYSKPQVPFLQGAQLSAAPKKEFAGLSMEGISKGGAGESTFEFNTKEGTPLVGISETAPWWAKVLGTGANTIYSGFVQQPATALNDAFDFLLTEKITTGSDRTAQKIYDVVQAGGQTDDKELEYLALQPDIQERAEKMVADGFGASGIETKGTEELATGLGLGQAAIGTTFTIPMASLEAAKELPGPLSYPAKSVGWVFEKLDELSRFAGTEALMAMPISDESKAILAQPVADLAGTFGALFGFKVLHSAQRGATRGAVEKLPVSEGTKGRITGAIESGVALSMDPFRVAYEGIVKTTSEKVKERMDKGIEITPDEAKKINNEVAKNVPFEMKSEMMVPTVEGTIKVQTDHKLVLQNFLKNNEYINYEVRDTLGKDPNGNPVQARFEWDYKNQKATIYTTNQTTSANLAHELGHFFDRVLSANVDARLSDMLPDYKANEQFIKQSLAGYAVEKLGGNATPEQINAEIMNIANQLREDIRVVATQESRAALSERFASAFGKTVLEPKKVEAEAPEFAKFMEFSLKGSDLIKRTEEAPEAKELTPKQVEEMGEKAPVAKEVTEEAVIPGIGKGTQDLVAEAKKYKTNVGEGMEAGRKILNEFYERKDITTDAYKAFTGGEAPPERGVRQGSRGDQAESDRVPQEVRQTGELSSIISSTGLETGKYVKGDSFRTDKFNTAKDVEELFSAISESSGNYKKQRVSKSDEDVKALAFEVGLTPEQLMKAKPGSIANAETVFAARRMVTDMAQELRDYIRTIDRDTATPAQMAKAKEMLFRLQGTSKAVAGLRTEAANVFRQFKLETTAGENDIMKELLSELKKNDMEAGDDLGAFTRKAKELVEPTAMDKFWHIWYSSILSGWTTQLKNIMGNVSQAALELGRIGITNPGELPVAAAGFWKGTLEGFAKAGEIMKQGETSKFEERGIKPLVFTGKYSQYLNYLDYVGRTLSSVDAISRGGGKMMELAGLAREQAMNEGFKGKDLEARISELMEKPTEDMTAQAERFGERMTYTQKPEGILGAISDAMGTATRKAPPVRLVVPFTRVVANVFNNGLDWTPIGAYRAMLPEGISKGKIPGMKNVEVKQRTTRERNQMLARAAIGTVAMGVFASMAANDQLSGNGPRDEKRREQLQATGWRQNSIKIGDKWYPYQNWGPMAVPMTIVGNFFDAKKYTNMEDKSELDRTLLAVQNTASSMLEMSFLRGVSDFFEMLNSPSEASLKQFIARQPSSLVPNLYKQIQRYFDPTIYEADSIKEMIMRDMRITSFGNTELRPQLNVWGEVRSGERISGLEPVKETPDQTLSFLVANDLFVSIPGKTTTIQVLRGERRQMTEDEYYEYVKRSGPEIKERLDSDLEYIQKLPDSTAQQEYINNIVSDVRDSVKNEIANEARRAEIGR